MGRELTDQPGRAAFAALARSSVVHVAFAFFAMGAWATFANRSAGMSHALIAGLLQGALSGGITWS